MYAVSWRIDVCIHIHADTCLCIHVDTDVHACMRGCVRMYAHGCARARVRACVHACVCACVRACVHVCARLLARHATINGPISSLGRASMGTEQCAVVISSGALLDSLVVHVEISAYIVMALYSCGLVVHAEVGFRASSPGCLSMGTEQCSVVIPFVVS